MAAKGTYSIAMARIVPGHIVVVLKMPDGQRFVLRPNPQIHDPDAACAALERLRQYLNALPRLVQALEMVEHHARSQAATGDHLPPALVAAVTAALDSVAK